MIRPETLLCQQLWILMGRMKRTPPGIVGSGLVQVNLGHDRQGTWCGHRMRRSGGRGVRPRRRSWPYTALRLGLLWWWRRRLRLLIAPTIALPDAAGKLAGPHVVAV